MPGPVTRMVEGGDRCGAARLADADQREAGFAGATVFGEMVLGGGAGLGAGRD